MAAAALAYVRAGEAAGLPRSAALRSVTLGVSVDGRFLLSVAKLRAARAIWARLAAAYDVAAPARIEARSSARMLSRLDAWTNLVRLTAAGFAGAVGGADAVVLAPFTEPLGPPTDFARRQARNTQLVLQEEAHLGRVADPAAGAWSLERITDELARRAWAVMQEIEREGGLLAALRTGRLQSEVAEARVALERDVATRKAGLVGVSEFPALADAPVETETVDPASFACPAPNVRQPGPDDTADPLAPMRLAAPFERLRQRAQAAEERPTAFLVELDRSSDAESQAVMAARISFTRNLLASAGIVSEVGLVDQARGRGMVILCGTDEAYARRGPDMIKSLWAAGVGGVWIAGKASVKGAEGNLVLGCDAPDVLSNLLTELDA